jgi:hypothetical protein
MCSMDVQAKRLLRVRQAANAAVPILAAYSLQSPDCISAHRAETGRVRRSEI